MTTDPRRMALWQAMSDCFLDTEVRPGLPLVAAAMIESCYADGELEEIWHHEVTPYCAPNLLSMVGEWGYFDIDPERMARIARSQTCVARLWHRLLARLASECWRGATEFTAFLRTLPPEQMRPSARALRAAGWAYFDLEWPLARAPVETEADSALLAAAFSSGLHMTYARLLLKSERRDEAQRRERALQALQMRA